MFGLRHFGLYGENELGNDLNHANYMYIPLSVVIKQLKSKKIQII